MNTCGTCKYKNTDPERSEVIYPDMVFTDRYEYECTGIPVPTDSNGDPFPLKVFFQCGKHKMKERLRTDEVLSTHAIAVDGSGYYAALCVDDDFGCIEWEEMP